MVLAIQFIGMLFGAGLLYLSFLFYKRKEFTLNEYFFWTLFSLMFVAISVFPNILNAVVKSLDLGRKLDFFIILGFMFMIAATFYTYMVARHSQKMIEKVVRRLAFQEQKDRQKKK